MGARNEKQQMMINHQSYILYFLIILFYGCQTKVSMKQPPVQQPNILFIAIDDLRPELGCYGADHMHSPNLDALAAKGMTFQRAYCQQAVCSPSRSSLLTGMRPDAINIHTIGPHFREFVPDVVTLPQYFKDQGYFTTWWGKIYHAWLLDSLSWSEEGMNQDRRIEPQWPKENWRAYVLDESNQLAATNDQGIGPAWERAEVHDTAYPDGIVAERVVEELGRLKKMAVPFFLAVGFYKPHDPWTAPNKYWKYYDSIEIDLPENWKPPRKGSRFGMNWHGYERFTNTEDTLPFSTSTVRNLRKAYYACVSYTDAQVGKVLDELSRLGLDKNTVVIVWGDHGYKLGEYSGWAKMTNYELDTRCPLIISTPEMSMAGKHSYSLVEFVDIYPTLCDLAGLPIPQTLQGKSFKSVLTDPRVVIKDFAISQYPRSRDGENVMGYAMRTERYRTVAWMSWPEKDTLLDVELYDHFFDPGENYNVAIEDAYAKDLKKMIDKLMELIQSQ